MRGGHNRVPDSVKASRGTLQKCRTKSDAVEAAPGEVPAPPRGMADDERAIWKELKREVEALGTYSDSDFTTFRLTVKTVAEALHPDPRDPATARVRLAQVAAGLLARFGLDPASRGRVSARPKAAEPDATEKLLFAGPLKVVDGGA